VGSDDDDGSGGGGGGGCGRRRGPVVAGGPDEEAGLAAIVLSLGPTPDALREASEVAECLLWFGGGAGSRQDAHPATVDSVDASPEALAAALQRDVASWLRVHVAAACEVMEGLTAAAEAAAAATQAAALQARGGEAVSAAAAAASRPPPSPAVPPPLPPPGTAAARVAALRPPPPPLPRPTAGTPARVSASGDPVRAAAAIARAHRADVVDWARRVAALEALLSTNWRWECLEGWERSPAP